ncbi:hypothetical protein ACQ4LE_009187 [Meloidogyne hapla]|uniref:Uncharacterized protein n=1 Tax=Meloidogyne hapla TaxID=6305 RepID=A0A1I8B7H8_MELHA
MFLPKFFLLNLFMLVELCIVSSFTYGIRPNQQQIQIINEDISSPIEMISKRAFDRVDVSTFDFNKRFNDFDDNTSPLGKLFIPSFKQQKITKNPRLIQNPSNYMTRKEQNLAKSSYFSSSLRKRPVARIYGFGIFGPLKLKRSFN